MSQECNSRWVSGANVLDIGFRVVGTGQHLTLSPIFQFPLPSLANCTFPEVTVALKEQQQAVLDQWFSADRGCLTSFFASENLCVFSHLTCMLVAKKGGGFSLLSSKPPATALAYYTSTRSWTQLPSTNYYRSSYQIFFLW